MKIFSRCEFLRLIALGSVSVALENLLSACGLKPVVSTPSVTDIPTLPTLPPDGEAEIIFTGGTILTMDTHNPVAEAIAIHGDSIIAVGPNAEVLQQRGTNTKVIDLQGHTLMPGFVDAHSHLGQNAQGDSGKFQQLQDDAIRKGITTTTEMYVDAAVMEQLKGYDRAGLMRMRWNTYLLYNTNCGDSVDSGWYKTYAQGEEITPHIRNQGVKLFSDGGSCHVPAVSFEYPDGYGHGDLFLTGDRITAIVKEVQGSNHQIAIHALGDRAIEEAQNAIADALNGAPNTHRHRIEHNAVLRDDLLPRYSEIGIVPTLFGSYATCWRVHPNSQFKYVVPAELGELEWPWRKLLDANPGLKAAWHSDFPVFPEISPMAHLYGFVTRDQAAEDGTVCKAPDWLKRGAIQVEEALPMMTINAAYAIFREHEIGSLETGKLADMVILSESPLRVQPEAIKDIRVLVTMIGGEVEYCAAGAEALCPAIPPVQSNTFPFGFIDVPVADATLSGTIDIAGWALDDTGIDQVEIYLDGNYVADALYGNPRPDVDHAYPGRENAPNFGFIYHLVTTAYNNGIHTIQAIAVNRAGNKKPLTPESLTITIAN